MLVLSTLGPVRPKPFDRSSTRPGPPQGTLPGACRWQTHFGISKINPSKPLFFLCFSVFPQQVEFVVAFRYTERTPTISDLARVVNTASRLLRFSNLDERIEVENAAVLALAKKRQLVS